MRRFLLVVPVNQLAALGLPADPRPGEPIPTSLTAWLAAKEDTALVTDPDHRILTQVATADAPNPDPTSGTVLVTPHVPPAAHCGVPATAGPGMAVMCWSRTTAYTARVPAAWLNPPATFQPGNRATGEVNDQLAAIECDALADGPPWRDLLHYQAIPGPAAATAPPQPCSDSVELTWEIVRAYRGVFNREWLANLLETTPDQVEPDSVLATVWPQRVFDALGTEQNQPGRVGIVASPVDRQIIGARWWIPTLDDVIARAGTVLQAEADADRPTDAGQILAELVTVLRYKELVP